MDELSARNWKRLWANKGINISSFDDDTLLRVAGYEPPFNFTSPTLAADVARVADALAILNGASVLDIGCGPGLFRKYLSKTLSLYCGLDYSTSLLKIARAIHATGVFVNAEASSIDCIGYRFDHVIANSVFQYFPSYDYARTVMSKAFSRLSDGGSAAILDLNDVEHSNAYVTARSSHFDEPDHYQKRYAGLAHMFYCRRTLAEDCKSIGFRRLRIENQNIPGYVNNAYRFNLYLWK
jgi:predicted TPR repeat methyltransferase